MGRPRLPPAYVNFALVARGFDGVPDDMPYVSTYPHNVEMLIIALRAMLPDDRLVDLAQIPSAVMGALAIAAIARRCGAARAPALAAGAAWLVVPAVFLQMPTDYVDVASAAFFLAAVYFVLSASLTRDAPSATRRALVLGGLALGLYLGTKPNAPLSAAVIAALLLWVGLRSRERAAALVGLFLVALGSETFVLNALRFGNPVWPVQVQIGPILLHGKTTMQHLLESGAAAPHLHGSLPSRIVRSWTALTSPPVFDMRIGGFGALVLASAPAALATLFRRKDAVAVGRSRGERHRARSRRRALRPRVAGAAPRLRRAPRPQLVRCAGGRGWARWPGRWHSRRSPTPGRD